MKLANLYNLAPKKEESCLKCRQQEQQCSFNILFSISI